MTIRILADRQPYSSYAAQLASDRDGAPNDLYFNGPAKLDDPSPDFLVLPAETFLSLARTSIAESEDHDADACAYLAYGPVDLMERAFQRGCADYLREPWAPAELRARVGRLCKVRFRALGAVFELKGALLLTGRVHVELSEREKSFLGLLLRNAPNPVPRAGAEISVFASLRPKKPELGTCAVSLRRKMESLHPGLGTRLRVIRGLGYRLDVDICG